LEEIRINEPPPRGRNVRFDAKFGQRFILTVDTEEEFDWSKPLDREKHSLNSIPRLAKFQQFCESHGVAPIYLVDYPIANSPLAAEILKDALKTGRAEIGIQLHPWVSPPFEEAVNQYNSFAGNLPEKLEREKLLQLRDMIESNFGVVPQIYRAGRYGTGPNTARILSEAAVAIDTSVRTHFDYSYAGGPNYRSHPDRPYWLDQTGGLLELPLTTVFWGPLRQMGSWLYPRLWRLPQLRGALSRLRLLERIPLTPEGVTLDEALRGIDVAIDQGLPVLVFSFHSPSLAPGYSPYVRTEDDLDAFYDWWREVFATLARRKIAASSVSEIMASVELA
jgi:hypothetical protein